MRLLTVFAALSLMTGLALAHPDHSPLPHWQKATGWPDRIVTTHAQDPATSISVAWRTDASVGRTIAQITEATPDARFDVVADTWRVNTQIFDVERQETPIGVRVSPFNIGVGRVAYHEYTFENLKPDTLYAWRVQGARGQWSEWFQTRTAPLEGPVSFVYFGDSQNGVYSHWSRVIRAAMLAAPDANFHLHAGDLVAKAEADYNWAEWFHAGGFIHAMIPTVPVPGNHENMCVWPDDPEAPLKRPRVKGCVRQRTPMWRAQFTLPEEDDLPAELHESVYDIRYSKDLHIFVVDSARKEFDDQARWLEEALKASDARWKIVSMHHPYFVSGAFDRDETDAKRRAAFAPVVDENGVDLVLAGHIHSYVRSSIRLGPDGKERTSRAMTGEPDAVRTLFVISASGAKSSDIYQGLDVEAGVGDGGADLGALSLDRVAGNTPMFQVLKIDGDVLAYEARMATGDVYDAFTLKKDEAGLKRLVEGDPEFGGTRLFDNTGPYREWWDLR